MIGCDGCTFGGECSLRGCMKTIPRGGNYTKLESAYMIWIKKQPCSVEGCGRSGIHAHHVENDGKGAKCYAIGGTAPLCVYHHETGPKGVAYHNSDPDEWYKKYLSAGDTLKDVAFCLMKKFFSDIKHIAEKRKNY